MWKLVFPPTFRPHGLGVEINSFEAGMAATQTYRVQHAELFEIVTQITPLIESGSLPQNAAEVRKLVSALAGKLSIHLAMEDKSLYPKLMTHKNPDVRALSTRYTEEMGMLAEHFTRFNQRWLTAQMIAKDAEGFVAEINLLFEALRTRIDKENHELFKLVDGLDD
jgi:iron-sulfur cluster repair protein YtfE (RIC family)